MSYVQLPGIRVDPTTGAYIYITTPTAVIPPVYSDPFGVNLVTMPLLITTPTVFYLPGPGVWLVNSQSVTLEGAQVAGITIPSSPFPGGPQFTPGVSPGAGGLAYYNNPLASSFTAFAKTIGIAGMVPYFSGPTGGKIIAWDVDVTIASSGGTIYAAAYVIVNQNAPFKYNVTPYAVLVQTAGSTVSTGTGRLTVSSLSIPFPPNTWFLFGGYNDVNAATTNCGTTVAGAFCPWGRFTVTGAGSSVSIACVDIDVPGQSGGSWPAAINDSTGNQGKADLGIGIKYIVN